MVNLTSGNINDTPEWEGHPFSCKYCIYWEFPEECVDPAKERKEEMLQKKLTWLRRTNREFGNCGKIVYADGKPVGYAEYAPARFLPGSLDYKSGPPSDDAVLISCLFVAGPEFRKIGIGTKMLDSVINELRERKVKAVETFARRGNSDNPSGPIEFYLRNGFKTHRNDSEFPLMRLEL